MTNKNHALQNAIAQIEKAFGKGALLRGEAHVSEEVEVISTGSLGLDLALGIGGLPLRRIIEIYGPESSGKTTLALHAIASAQKAGGECAFIDVEHAFDRSYARRLGLNVDTLVRSGAVRVIVVDSVAAIGCPSQILEGDMGDAHMVLSADTG